MRIFLPGKTDRFEKESGFILLRSLLISSSVLLALCAVLLVFAHTLRTEGAVLKNAQDFVRNKNNQVLSIVRRG